MITVITIPNKALSRSFIAVILFLLSNQIHALDTLKGNIEKGREIATKKCDRCHGNKGVSDDSDTPHLSAQSSVYLFKQLEDYKSKTRVDKNMYKRARKLNKQQMIDLSLWFESQTLPKTNSLDISKIKIPQLVNKGDPSRGIPPCNICHGKDGKTVANGVPILSGQYADYLIWTMENFRDGSRNNDPVGAVQAIIKKMTDEEIEAIAKYYTELGGRVVQE